MEEEEEEDGYQEDEPPEDSNAYRFSDGKERKGFYEKVHNVLPGKIHMSNAGRHRSLINIGGTPHINLNPDWEGSWLDTPKGSGSNTVGVWPPKTKFPGSGTAQGADMMVPEDFIHKVPVKFDYHIQNPELKTYLETTKMLRFQISY